MLYIYIYTNKHVYIHMCIYVYIHTYTHTYIQWSGYLLDTIHLLAKDFGVLVLVERIAPFSGPLLRGPPPPSMRWQSAESIDSPGPR